MVAKTAPLPNIKKLFRPDPGYVICDCDIAQADARVVAWEANDDKLKEIFNDPTADLHNENAKDIFGVVNKRTRPLAKAGVHATNYYCKARTLARTLGITVKEAEHFQSRWFAAHPGILDWHYRVENSLLTSREVRNAFGFRRFYFDRVQTILPEALAWIPQSTVALTINRGMLNLDKELPEIEMLLQVHDSCAFQVKIEKLHGILPKIKQCLEVEVPYEDPLIMPVGIEVSTKTWGDVKEIPWDISERDLMQKLAA